MAFPFFFAKINWPVAGGDVVLICSSSDERKRTKAKRSLNERISARKTMTIMEELIFNIFANERSEYYERNRNCKRSIVHIIRNGH